MADPRPIRWKTRRRMATAAMLYFAALIAYIVWRGEDTALYRDALTTFSFALTAILSSYVGVATWNDVAGKGRGGPEGE